MSEAPFTPAAGESLQAQALALLLALDDHDLPDRERAVAKRLVRLTYLSGIEAIYLARQQQLGVFDDVGKTHLGDVLAELVRRRIVLVHADRPLYRVLPDVQNWQCRSRCRDGHEYARALAADLLRAHHERVGQGDFAALEESFTPPPSLDDGLAEVSREQGVRPPAASSTRYLRSPGTGAAGGRVQENPPGVIQDAGAVGSFTDPAWVREQTRRSLESVGVVVDAVDIVPVDTDPARTAGVTKKGTFGCINVRTGWETELPKRELPRARPSDDHLLQDHLPNPVQRTSSSDQSDDQGDDRRGDERRGAGKWQMVPMTDGLLDDLRRELGEKMGSFTVPWRRAIFLARECVYEALAALKVNRQTVCKHPGGYLRTCFLNECRQRRIVLPEDLFPAKRKSATPHP